MKVWYDLNMNIPNEKKKFFQFSRYSDKYTLLGIEKHDGQGAITLKPGDVVQLTDMEIAANEHRIIFKDGLLVEITSEDVKQLVARVEQEKQKILSDIELEELLSKPEKELINFINTCDNKINIKKLYKALNNDVDKNYKYIKAIEQKFKDLND